MVSDLELLVRKVTWLPNRIASWVPEPLVIVFSDVSDVVELLSWVFLVNIFASSREIIAAVLNTPEPQKSSVVVRILGKEDEYVHAVAVKRDSDLVSHSIACEPPARNIIIASTRDCIEVEYLNAGTSCLWVARWVIEIIIRTVRHCQ